MRPGQRSMCGVIVVDAESFWPTRLIFLAMGEVLSFGFNLAVPFPVTAGAARHVLFCCHRG